MGGLGYEGKNTHERPSEKRQQLGAISCTSLNSEKRMNAQSSNNMFSNSAKAETTINSFQKGNNIFDKAFMNHTHILIITQKLIFLVSDQKIFQ